MKPNSFLRFGIAEFFTMLVLIAIHLSVLKALVGIHPADSLHRKVAFAVLGAVIPIAAAYAATRSSTRLNERSLFMRCFTIVLFDCCFLTFISMISELSRF